MGVGVEWLGELAGEGRQASGQPARRLSVVCAPWVFAVHGGLGLSRCASPLLPHHHCLPSNPPTLHALPAVQPAGDRAWETVFSAWAPVIRGEPVTSAALYSVVMQIPLEGEYLLRHSGGGRWGRGGQGRVAGGIKRAER